MIITPITTRTITSQDKSLTKILDEYLVSFPEGSILAITSKIISLTEGRVIAVDKAKEADLIKKEADRWLAADPKYHIQLTIKDNILIPNSGIDQSNGNGSFILWPKNAQKSANDLRIYLKKRFSLAKCGVIITDSKTTPLRWGVTGVTLAHSGFAALHDYRGQPDVFGRKLEVTQSNVADALAAAAVLEMGEGNEQKPLAVLSNLPYVVFQDRNPSPKELGGLHIDIKDDLYAPLLQSVKWQK